MTPRPSIAARIERLLLGPGSLPGTARIAWLVAIVAAVAIRAAMRLTVARPSDPELWEFGTIARNLVETGVFSYRVAGVPSAYMPPGYPLLIAGLYSLLGNGLGAHLVLGAILLAAEIAIPFLLRAIAAMLWGPSAGRWALGLALFWPQFLLLSARYHSLSLNMALALAALAVIWRPSGSLLARSAVCGLLLGLYGTLRLELAIVLVPFAYAVWTAPDPGAGQRASRGRRLAALVVLLGCCAIPVAPWLVRNTQAFGRPILGTSTGYNLLRGHNEDATGGGRSWTGSGDPENVGEMIKRLEPDYGKGTDASGRTTYELFGVERLGLDYTKAEDELRADDLFRRSALAFARAHPRRELELLGMKAVLFLVTDFTHPVQRRAPVWVPSLLALLAGLVYAWRTRCRDPRERVLWLLFAGALAVSLVFFVLPRYRMAVEFVPVLFCAAALSSVWRRVRPGSVVAADPGAAARTSA